MRRRHIGRLRAPRWGNCLFWAILAGGPIGWQWSRRTALPCPHFYVERRRGWRWSYVPIPTGRFALGHWLFFLPFRGRIALERT